MLGGISSKGLLAPTRGKRPTPCPEHVNRVVATPKRPQGMAPGRKVLVSLAERPAAARMEALRDIFAPLGRWPPVEPMPQLIHATAYLRSEVGVVGLAIRALSTATLREEAGSPVTGYVLATRRP